MSFINNFIVSLKHYDCLLQPMCKIRELLVCAAALANIAATATIAIARCPSPQASFLPTLPSTRLPIAIPAPPLP